MQFGKRWTLGIRVGILTVAVLAVKVVIHYLALDMLSNTPLLSSVIGGAIFLIGFIVAGTIGDFKEAEKMPSDMVASLEAILEEGRYIKQLKPEFAVDKLDDRLGKVAKAIVSDLHSRRKRLALLEIGYISESAIEAERLGVAGAWIGRIKAEQSALKRMMLRAYQIKETVFIPAAHALVDFTIAIVVTLLLFMRLDPFIDSLIMSGVIMFIYLYMTFLINDIDDPFDAGDGSSTDVDLFLLKAFGKKGR